MSDVTHDITPTTGQECRAHLASRFYCRAPLTSFAYNQLADVDSCWACPVPPRQSVAGACADCNLLPVLPGQLLLSCDVSRHAVLPLPLKGAIIADFRSCMTPHPVARLILLMLMLLMLMLAVTKAVIPP
jgi:hypothetical protein